MNGEYLSCECADLFLLEVESMQNAILGHLSFGRFFSDPEDPVKNQKVIDTLFRSALLGKTLEISEDNIDE